MLGHRARQREYLEVPLEFRVRIFAEHDDGESGFFL